MTAFDALPTPGSWKDRTAEAALEPQQIHGFLATNTGWSLAPSTQQLERTVRLPTAESTLSFAKIVLDLAKELRATPTLIIRGSSLTIILGSEGVTRRDLRLATHLDALGGAPGIRA